MKEKRVDICLAKAAFWQVIFFGFGGTLMSELIKLNQARRHVVLTCLVVICLSVLLLVKEYSKASRISKKSKHKLS